MPRLTLLYGGSFHEPITSGLFFPPLYAKLTLEPSINPMLLKGFAIKVDDFVIGSQFTESGGASVSVAHLELALLDDRRSPLILEELADCMQDHMRGFFARSLADQTCGCYITSDVRLIPAKWHRSISRRAPPTPTKAHTINSASLSIVGKALSIIRSASPRVRGGVPRVCRAVPIVSRKSAYIDSSAPLRNAAQLERSSRALLHVSANLANLTRQVGVDQKDQSKPRATNRAKTHHRMCRSLQNTPWICRV